MLRTLLLCSLGTLALGVLLGSAAAPAPACPNTIVNEPVVVFDRLGPFAGPIGGFGPATSLVIHNSGLVLVAEANDSGFDTQARITFVAPLDVQQLLLDLSALGAGQACDGPPSPIESAVHTLTLLRDATDARAHTFSWRVSQGAYGPIHDRLRGFVQAAFPSAFPGF